MPSHRESRASKTNSGKGRSRDKRKGRSTKKSSSSVEPRVYAQEESSYRYTESRSSRTKSRAPDTRTRSSRSTSSVSESRTRSSRRRDHSPRTRSGRRKDHIRDSRQDEMSPARTIGRDKREPQSYSDDESTVVYWETVVYEEPAPFFSGLCCCCCAADEDFRHKQSGMPFTQDTYEDYDVPSSRSLEGRKALPIEDPPHRSQLMKGYQPSADHNYDRRMISTGLQHRYESTRSAKQAPIPRRRVEATPIATGESFDKPDVVVDVDTACSIVLQDILFLWRDPKPLPKLIEGPRGRYYENSAFARVLDDGFTRETGPPLPSARPQLQASFDEYHRGKVKCQIDDTESSSTRSTSNSSSKGPSKAACRNALAQLQKRLRTESPKSIPAALRYPPAPDTFMDNRGMLLGKRNRSHSGEDPVHLRIPSTTIIPPTYASTSQGPLFPIFDQVNMTLATKGMSHMGSPFLLSYGAEDERMNTDIDEIMLNRSCGSRIPPTPVRSELESRDQPQTEDISQAPAMAPIVPVGKAEYAIALHGDQEQNHEQIEATESTVSAQEKKLLDKLAQAGIKMDREEQDLSIPEIKTRSTYALPKTARGFLDRRAEQHTASAEIHDPVLSKLAQELEFLQSLLSPPSSVETSQLNSFDVASKSKFNSTLPSSNGGPVSTGKAQVDEQKYLTSHVKEVPVSHFTKQSNGSSEKEERDVLKDAETKPFGISVSTAVSGAPSDVGKVEPTYKKSCLGQSMALAAAEAAKALTQDIESLLGSSSFETEDSRATWSKKDRIADLLAALSDAKAKRSSKPQHQKKSETKITQKTTDIKKRKQRATVTKDKPREIVLKEVKTNGSSRASREEKRPAIATPPTRDMSTAFSLFCEEEKSIAVHKDKTRGVAQVNATHANADSVTIRHKTGAKRSAPRPEALARQRPLTVSATMQSGASTLSTSRQVKVTKKLAKLCPEIAAFARRQ